MAENKAPNAETSQQGKPAGSDIDHPLRWPLNAELHSRPPMLVHAPSRSSHFAFINTTGGHAEDRSHIEALVSKFSPSLISNADNQIIADFRGYRLKWERHTEFSTYSIYVDSASAKPFAEPAVEALPSDWRKAIPGERIAAIHIEFLALASLNIEATDIDRFFANQHPAGSIVNDGLAEVWTDFRIHQDGFGRLLINDKGLTGERAGRLIQRLWEIDTYRMMALLGFPVAREVMTSLNQVEDRLGKLVLEMNPASETRDDRSLLTETLSLAERSEELVAKTSYRYAATRAYHALVQRRIEELREKRIQGAQRISNFLGRRLEPAMRTVEASEKRLTGIAHRINRAADLLRTRVDLGLKQQNQEVLTSMAKRASLQLRLQQTIEGLSVVAIGYYAIGIAGILIKASKGAGAPIDPTVATGIAAVPILILVAIVTRRIRRHIERDGD
ncbi:MAG: DUF3422 domain-containing protein [Pseudomonadota bacterium]